MAPHVLLKIESMEVESQEQIATRRANTRREYDVTLHFLATNFALTEVDELKVLKKLASLKSELDALGEKFTK